MLCNFAQSKLEGVRRRVPHGLRVLGKYGDSLLDGISEGNEEEWV